MKALDEISSVQPTKARAAGHRKTAAANEGGIVPTFIGRARGPPTFTRGPVRARARARALSTKSTFDF